MGRTHEVDGPDSIVPSFSLWSITIWVRILWGLFANLCCRGLELCELGATWVAYFMSCRMYYIIIRKYMNIWWKIWSSRWIILLPFWTSAYSPVSGAHRQMVATYRLSWTGGLEISPRAFQEIVGSSDRGIVDQNSRKNMEGSWRILVISKVCEVHQRFYPTSACSLYSWSETTPTMSLDKSWQRVWTYEASLGRDWTGLSWWYSVTSTIRGPAEVQCSNLSWRSWWRWKAAEVFGWCRKEQLLQNLQRALMVKKVTHCIFCDWSLFQNQNMAVGMHLNKKAEPGLGFFGELHVCMFYVFFMFFSL